MSNLKARLDEVIAKLDAAYKGVNPGAIAHILPELEAIRDELGDDDVGDQSEQAAVDEEKLIEDRTPYIDGAGVPRAPDASGANFSQQADPDQVIANEGVPTETIQPAPPASSPDEGVTSAALSGGNSQPAVDPATDPA